MRTMLTVFGAVALLGGGCRKREHEPTGDRTETPSRETQARRGTDLDHTPGTQARARANFANDMHEQLTKIDAKIDELSKSPEPAKRDIAEGAKTRRDQLAHKLDAARETPSDQWDLYKKDVEDQVKALDEDLNLK